VCARLLIDDKWIHPDEVTVDLMLDVANASSRFGIEICLYTLHHELQEVGIQIRLDQVVAFVQEDLLNHPRAALEGYLSIVRGILDYKKKRWSLFARRGPKPMIKWLIVRTESVLICEERLLIRGIAAPIPFTFCISAD
jgi:hypothetical protein